MSISKGLRVIAAIVAVCLGVAARAQMTTVTASALGTSANPLADGTIYWQLVSPAKAGSGGGQILGSARSATVTGGAFSLTLPDALAAAPNTCYRVTAVDNVTGKTVLGAGLATNGFDVNPGGGYACVEVTGSSWNFDTYQPTATLPALYVPVPGPQGPTGPAGANNIPGLDTDGANGITVAGAVRIGGPLWANQYAPLYYITPGHYSWKIGCQTETPESCTFTPSTVSGGTTFTTPVLTLSPSGTLTVNELKIGSNYAPTVASPTVNHAACIKAAGPPVVIGYCSTVVDSSGACTCN
jgi:hypothetical protein